jgi:hypothetical protein
MHKYHDAAMHKFCLHRTMVRGILGANSERAAEFQRFQGLSPPPSSFGGFCAATLAALFFARVFPSGFAYKGLI